MSGILERLKARALTLLRGRWALFIYRWISTAFDPIRLLGFVPGITRYFRDGRRYRALPGAERLRLSDSHPCIHDRTDLTPFGAHYFYQANWATRHVVQSAALTHVDIASQVGMSGMLAAWTQVVFVDIRPIAVTVPNLSSVEASGLQLPFADASLSSVSCLHVMEHVGLGRYGDPLDPQGSRKLCAELERVVAPSGQLLLSAPLGRSRVCFNAHRVHSYQQVVSFFPALQLVDVAGVDDSGNYVENLEPDSFRHADYALGMFRFQRNGSFQ